MNTLPEMMLAGIRNPVAALDSSNRFLFANPAAEEFFRSSAATLKEYSVNDFFDGVILTMLERARLSGNSVSDQGIDVNSPRLGLKRINIQVSPLQDTNNTLVLVIQERQLAERLRGQQQFRGGGAVHGGAIRAPRP